VRVPTVARVSAGFSNSIARRWFHPNEDVVHARAYVEQLRIRSRFPVGTDVEADRCKAAIQPPKNFRKIFARICHQKIGATSYRLPYEVASILEAGAPEKGGGRFLTGERGNGKTFH
jgi:hypothetical protein